MLNQIMRPIAQRAFRRATQSRLAHGHHGPSNPLAKHVTFDEACVPQGSWKEHFDKKQAKYNVHLIGGVSALVLTIAAIGQFELLFFNYAPPKPKN